jgi:hypothetical protein
MRFDKLPLGFASNHSANPVCRRERRRHAVAFEPFARPIGPRRRGRPRLYGRKIKLRTLFDTSTDLWQEVESPVYGERGVTVRFSSRDLLWRPLRRVVRFVLVDHPTRGRCIFFSTDLTLSAIDIISGNGLRFKIELSFKQAVRVLGAYNYHFWMRGMRRITRNSTQHMQRQTDPYRAAVRRKLAAYDRHIQIGLIAQGLLQYLSATHAPIVWSSFGSWLRTIRDGVCVPRNSSLPSRCATHCPIFSSNPPQPQSSQNSCATTSIPTTLGPCASPDRLKSSFYGSIELRLLGKGPAGRRTGHRQIGTSSEKEWQFQFVLGKFSKVIFIAPIFVCSLSSMSQAVFARKQACSKSTADKGCWRVWEVDKAWGSR